MLRPKDVNPTPTPDTKTAQRANIAQGFDFALRRAAESGEWPAEVANHRDGALTPDIDAVAEEYRKLGWIVTRPRRGPRALIDHPDRAKGAS